MKRSNALHSHLRGRPYLTGPIARYSLNSDRLSPLAREAAQEAGLGPTCSNPFRSIVVRAVEVLYACDEALRIIGGIPGAGAPASRSSSRVPASGYACTEAPRGMLYHRYRLDAEGTIVDAKIVPPTSQNQPSIEEDLQEFCRGLARHAGRGAAHSLRAGGAQPRPVHLVRHAFPEAGGGACLTR